MKTWKASTYFTCQARAWIIKVPFYNRDSGQIIITEVWYGLSNNAYMQNEGEIEINITDKEGYGLILDNSGIEFLNQGLLKMDSIGFSGI